MSSSGKEGDREGKLAIDVMETILDSIPTTGLPVPNRMGMDAAIVRAQSEKIFCFSRVVFGLENQSAFNDVFSNLENRASELGKIIVIDPVVLFPTGTSSQEIGQVVLQIAEAAKSHGIIVGKGHTEITSKVNVSTLIATVLGSLRA